MSERVIVDNMLALLVQDETAVQRNEVEYRLQNLLCSSETPPSVSDRRRRRPIREVQRRRSTGSRQTAPVDEVEPEGQRSTAVGRCLSALLLQLSFDELS